MSKRKVLYCFFLILFFFLGFAFHALFFPTILTRNILLYSKKTLENKPVPTPGAPNTNKALTLVSFDEGEFDPQVVIIGKSYYIAITNKSSKELMTLTSENPLFRTPRGYGESEQLLVQLYDVGEYRVSSTLHPDKALRVIVK